MIGIAKTVLGELKPLATAGSLLRWILRDPAAPPRWKVIANGLGIVFAQYAQSAIIFLLALLFVSSENFPGMALIGEIVPLEILQEYRLYAPILLVIIFVSQAALNFICRKGLVNHSIAYYRANANRAFGYYRAGLTDNLRPDQPLLGSDLLISFCLRESRYLGGSFLSLSNTITSLMSLGFGLIVLFTLDWFLTLILSILVLSAGLFQATIIKKGLAFSEDILVGSGEMVLDIREHLTKFSATPYLKPEKSRALLDGLEVPGARRFLLGYQNRISLPYASALLAQLSFAIVLGIAITIFLFRHDNGQMSSSEIFRYCIFLLPVFGALIGLLNTVIGITTSLPYFQSYIDLFSTKKMQQEYHNWGMPYSEQASNNKVSITHSKPLGWNTVLAPIIQLEWPELQRLRNALDKSGILPIGIDISNLLLMPSQWPKQIKSIESFLELKEPMNFERLNEQHPALSAYIEEVREALQRVQTEKESNTINTDDFSPREKALLFLLASLQEKQILIMAMRGFCSIGERDRMFLVSSLPEASVLCVIPHADRNDYLPRLHRGAAVFGDGSWVKFDPNNLSNIDQALRDRLENESIILTTKTNNRGFLEEG